MYKNFLITGTNSVKDGCNRTCTRTRTAGKSFTAASFPDTHFQGMAVNNLNKFRVYTVREYFVILKESTCSFKVKGINIINKYNRMGISH